MAKLWEVIKAMQEGKAEKAFRTSTAKHQIFLRKNEDGISFFLNDGANPCEYQGLGNKDLDGEWQIVEVLERKEFRVIQALFKLHGHGRSTRKIPELFENNSLKNAVDCLQRDYPEDVITVLGAVGISDTGEITILAQNGVAIDG